MPDVISSVPRLINGGTIVCIATGPSLTAEDVELCRGRVDGAVAVNDAYQFAPWAFALMASDATWWAWHRSVPDFHGLKYCLQPFRDLGPRSRALVHGVTVLKNTGESGIETDPTGLRTCRNSGGAAINVAVHLGASTILLLGYDMKAGHDGRSHFFGEHERSKRRSPFPMFIKHYELMVKPLHGLGIRVINCSRESALTCFPRMSLHDALRAEAA